VLGDFFFKNTICFSLLNYIGPAGQTLYIRPILCSIYLPIKKILTTIRNRLELLHFPFVIATCSRVDLLRNYPKR